MLSRQLPNAISLIRLAAAPILAWFILQARFREAFGLLLLAGVTDWLDGFAARRLHLTSKTGTVLDPLADKTMLVTLFVSLTIAGLIPRWLLALVILRDIVIVAGALLLRAFRNIRTFRPSTMGKVSTFFQISFVLTVLVDEAFPERILFWLRMIGFGLTVLFTLLSGWDYVRTGIRMARQPISKRDAWQNRLRTFS